MTEASQASNAAPVRVLVAGIGHMGRSHALACHHNPGFEIVGLVNRGDIELPTELEAYPMFRKFADALQQTQPALCSINTYSDSHANYAIMAMQQGAHVFVEKPLATNLADAERVVDCARKNKRKLVVGYILRHHPSWQRLIEESRKLGGPYVFRMNLNQRSSGETWDTHKRLMDTTSPIVDCGVHYVDVMCQITDARPVRVHGMGLRLSDEIAEDMYNYGHLQVLFDDGSVGWYEAGWGPMMSDTAFFVKDVISPKGALSIIVNDGAKSDDMETHTRTSLIRIQHAEVNPTGEFAKADTLLDMAGEPGHQGLCDFEQAYVLSAIRDDIDLNRHMNDAIQSLKICLAADQSIRQRTAIDL